MESSSVFWTNSPTVLIDLSNVSALWETNQPRAARFNGLSQLVILLTILTIMYCQSIGPMIMGMISLVIIIAVYRFRKPSVEGNLVMRYQERTLPTEANPLMNVMPQDFKKCPNRPPAALSYKPQVKKLIDENVQNSLGAKVIDPRLFKELGGGGAAREEDLFFDQSMHQFYPTPSTQIPNSQTAFAEWCYGDMISAKEGNKKALLQGAPPNWTNG